MQVNPLTHVLIYKYGIFSYVLLSMVKSFSLYSTHVQPVLLALLIFVTSIPFPL